MEVNYKLDNVHEIAGGDLEFVKAVAQSFVEEIPADLSVLKEAIGDKNFTMVHQIAHKMKSTIDMFKVGILEDLIVVQDWGKYEGKEPEDVQLIFAKVEAVINTAVKELQSDFDL
jgi:hypothetical protein